jgi:hypothetical protein
MNDRPQAPQKLTKGYLFTLPAGVLLVSGCMASMSGYDPKFREVVASTRDRNEQWHRITRSGAAGRNCYVFQTEQEWRAWVASIVGPHCALN